MIGTLSPEFVTEHIRGRNIQPLAKGDFLTELERRQYPQELIRVFGEVRREFFIPKGVPPEYAYANCSWPLKEPGYDTTISDPFVVAKMTMLLAPQSGSRVLEIGTGSGYQAAILKALVGPEGLVTTTEIDEDVIRLAQNNLQNAGITGVEVIQVGNENPSYQNKNPYDGILATCSVPPVMNYPLFDQLANGGKLVIPLGGLPVHFGIPDPNACALIIINKDFNGRLRGEIGDDEAMGFVTMKGPHGWDGVPSFDNSGTLLNALKEFLTTFVKT